jgi:hypothetical protein
LPAKPNYYEKESPMFVDLVHVWNNSKNKYGIEKSMGDRFAIKF